MCSTIWRAVTQRAVCFVFSLLCTASYVITGWPVPSQVTRRHWALSEPTNALYTVNCPGILATEAELLLDHLQWLLNSDLQWASCVHYK